MKRWLAILLAGTLTFSSLSVYAAEPAGSGNTGSGSTTTPQDEISGSGNTDSEGNVGETGNQNSVGEDKDDEEDEQDTPFITNKAKKASVVDDAAGNGVSTAAPIEEPAANTGNSSTEENSSETTKPEIITNKDSVELYVGETQILEAKVNTDVAPTEDSSTGNSEKSAEESESEDISFTVLVRKDAASSVASDTDTAAKTAEVKWNSKDSKIATVDAKTGVVTAVGEGETYVNAVSVSTKYTVRTLVKVKAAKKTGWVTVNGIKYYYGTDGVMKTGWQSIDGNKYYFLPNGVMYNKGWASIGGKWYYFNSNGTMQTAWASINGSKYYFLSNGVMYNQGWASIGGKWYYFLSSGVAYNQGWASIGGKKYYFLSNSVMYNQGWASIGGKWYYFGSSGAALTGWQTIDGARYYFYSDGSRAVNTTIDGYKIGSDGKAVASDAMTSKAQRYSSNTGYLVLVNKSTHKAGIYRGSKGKWTLYKGYWSCSTGANKTPTPSGTFKMTKPNTKHGSYGWLDFRGSSAAFCYNVSAGFWTHTILLKKGSRGNPYNAKKIDSRLGYNISHSCIRFAIANEDWIYHNIPRGTTLVVY